MKRIMNILVFLIFFFIININIVKADTLNCNVNLTRGSNSQMVKVLQSKLNQTMQCNLTVDGIFGSATYNCVTAFQQKYNLEIDGIVGPKTCRQLNALTVSKLSKSKAIVITSEANIRKGPSTNSSILKKVSMGQSLNIVSKVDEWYKIQITKNSYGYIRSDLITQHIIIVDISEQMLNYYENGENVLSVPVVTGMKNKHDTPLGTYVLKKANKQRGQTLRGTNDNGSKYASYVDYWMPFITTRGIGFHDASWRSAQEFNSSTYINNGSHGCVNMQHDDAKKLYESITQNTAVIVQA